MEFSLLQRQLSLQQEDALVILVLLTSEIKKDTPTTGMMKLELTTQLKSINSKFHQMHHPSLKHQLEVEFIYQYTLMPKISFLKHASPVKMVLDWKPLDWTKPRQPARLQMSSTPALVSNRLGGKNSLVIMQQVIFMTCKCNSYGTTLQPKITPSRSTRHCTWRSWVPRTQTT